MSRTGATARQFTASGLKARCRALRAQLTGQEIATSEEVAAVWPGGAENTALGMDGWIECYAQLTRFAGRLEHTGEGVPDARLEQAVRAAAARQPVPVSLSIGERMVYPKSAWALSFLDSLDAVIAPVVALQMELAEALPTNDELRALPPLVAGMAWRTWAWVLLTEGVELPFPDEGVIDPPQFTEQLLPQDYLAIWKAHRELHYDASVIMALALPKEGGETSRLSLGGFLAGYASEHGIAPSVMVRRWSFPEAMAAAVASAEANRVADANAKRKSGEAAG